MRRLWLFALALTILVPLLAVMLVFLAVAGESQAQCGASLFTGTSGPVGGVPAQLVPIYRGAAAKYGLGPRGPSILAAINYVESDFGQNLSTSSAGAVGWMQFLPSSWARYGVTPDGSKAPMGPAGWNDPADAIYSAANLLKAYGAPGDWAGAIFAYNHSSAYVQEVLSRAAGYYTEGLTAQGSGGTTTSISGTSGVATAGRPFTVAPASGDPAGPITLAQGQPTIVAATFFTDRTGAWGDDLSVSRDSYAELSPGIPGSQVTRQNATMLGGLPYMTPLEVTNPQNGRSVILYKRDIGAGQPLSNTFDGYHYRVDLTAWADQQLGLAGSGLVQVSRLNGPVNGPGGGQACSSIGVAPGQYVNPLAHARNITPQRIDMGVDYDGEGEIDAIGNARITFAGTGIGGGWVCSTATNGGVVYQLERRSRPGQMGVCRRGRDPDRECRRHGPRRPADRDVRTAGRDRVHRDRLGVRSGLPVTDRASGRRLSGRPRVRRLAHRRRQRHERPDPLARRPLRHLPQPADRGPLPVNGARLLPRRARTAACASGAAVVTARTGWTGEPRAESLLGGERVGDGELVARSAQRRADRLAGCALLVGEMLLGLVVEHSGEHGALLCGQRRQCGEHAVELLACQ